MDKKEHLEIRYLKTLAKQYPTIGDACTEIINLQSILNLPKGTEHFLTDLHGEYEAFSHILKNGSGSVRRKIDEEFGHTLTERDKKSLATLVYYPKEKLRIVEKEESNLKDWYTITLYRLIQLSKRVSSKYTRSKVRKALPKDFAYVIEEMITEKEEVQDKEGYYNEIINTIIRIGRAQNFIVALCELIQRLVVDHLHIVGDIFDRGPDPHRIMERLMHYHSVDIQWGNHDVLWMGAAAGHTPCIANVVRIAAKYGNLDTLEDGYGINLLPLATFALETYEKDDCSCFEVQEEQNQMPKDRALNRMMHKAITVIQFKLEGQLIKRRPEFQMDHRLLLDKVDPDKGVLRVGGEEYPILDSSFPTVDWKDPYALSEGEQVVVERLHRAFAGCEKLQEHIRFLYTRGSLYKVHNSNLLYHGCVPFNEDGSFREVEIFGKKYSGKGLYDILEQYARRGYYSQEGQEEREKGQDILWYIWSSENSPVFGKAKMATFERYFLSEKKLQNEKKNVYYKLIEKRETIEKILKEFGLDTKESHIVNGHMPVQLKKGETPIKGGGKLFIIDGGLSKAYQSKTGIAGYTLVYNSYGLRLVSHEPFKSMEEAIRSESDIHSDSSIVETVRKRRLVADTDVGLELKERIRELEELLQAYRDGAIIEKA